MSQDDEILPPIPVTPEDFLSLLADAATNLTVEVRELREEVSNEKQRNKTQRIVIFFLVVAMLVAGIAAYSSYQDRKHIRRNAKTHNDQAIGLAVGICAIGNISRIDMANFVAEIINRDLFEYVPDPEKKAQIDAFLAEQQQKFGQLPDCETFVPKDRPDIEIRLEYPSTIPPITSTTVTP